MLFRFQKLLSNPVCFQDLLIEILSFYFFYKKNFAGGPGSTSRFQLRFEYLPKERQRTEVGVEGRVEGEGVEADEEQGRGLAAREPQHQHRDQRSLGG